MKELPFYQNKLISLVASKTLLEKEIQEKELDIENCSKDAKRMEQALFIIQKVAQETQSQLEYRITDIVTPALQAIMEEDYELKIDFKQKNNRTVADLYLLKKGKKYYPLDDNGGGISDITAFGLRLALWKLSVHTSRNTFLLDEAFKHVSSIGGLQEKIVPLLKTISDKLNIQFICVSHTDELIENSDKVFKIKQKDEISYIEGNGKRKKRTIAK